MIGKTQGTICWTPMMLNRFKLAYNSSIAQGRDQFVFDGRDFMVSYAKYMIEYLDAHFKGRV